MTRVLIVDWLGRGGISHCTDAWRIELQRHGAEVRVVTRPDRELVDTSQLPGSQRGGRVRQHRDVAQRAARIIGTWQPEFVVVQNFVLPLLERPVHRAALSAGAHLVQVIHDHRHHERLGGTTWGLRRLLTSAGTVVSHSNFVAAQVERFAGIKGVQVLPLPKQLGILEAPRGRSLLRQSGGLVAMHFGVVRKNYKGGDVFVRIAAADTGPWRFAIVGAGAKAAPPVEVIPGFIDAPDLVATVAEAAVAILPYRFVTQSGAVVLAQALGVIPIVARAGGLPEQVSDGVTGLLVDPAAPDASWLAALRSLDSDAVRQKMAVAGRATVDAAHDRFVEGVVALMALPATPRSARTPRASG